MDALLFGISKFLDIILNWVIVALAAGEVFIMVRAIRSLRVLKKDIDRMTREPRRTLSEVTREPHRVSKKYTVPDQEMDWTEFDEFCNRYQEEGKWYSAFSMIIQLFTLLGILGTVCGLFIALRNGQGIRNAEELYEGVKFALSSTILGIIFAVIFKACEVFISSWYVNYIDDGIARFQNNFREDSFLAEPGTDNAEASEPGAENAEAAEPDA